MSWTLPLRCRRLAVGQDPHVGADAGVVEHVGRQSDDGLDEIVLQDVAADLALAGSRAAGEQRRPVEHDAEAAAALGAGRIFEIRCSRNSSDPSQTRGSPGPKRPLKPFSSCSLADLLLDLLPLHAERRIGEHVVELLAR